MEVGRGNLCVCARPLERMRTADALWGDMEERSKGEKERNKTFKVFGVKCDLFVR